MSDQLTGLKAVELLSNYKVHEVFFCDSVKVSVTIGESKRRGQYQEVDNRRFEHKGKIPIAFCADKFPFTSLGVIGMRQKTDAKQLRYSRNDASFLRFLS